MFGAVIGVYRDHRIRLYTQPTEVRRSAKAWPPWCATSWSRTKRSGTGSLSSTCAESIARVVLAVDQSVCPGIDLSSGAGDKLRVFLENKAHRWTRTTWSAVGVPFRWGGTTDCSLGRNWAPSGWL